MNAPFALPPTVNMHVVGHCNYACKFCYARFVRDKEFLGLDAARSIIDALAERKVRRITYAGGEPTLHDGLLAMLQHSVHRNLVTSLVTNGSRIDDDFARRHFPWLRWLALSCDSAVTATCRALGRSDHGARIAQPDRVREVCALVKRWNAARPESERVHLKLNMVVTSLNAHEDPSEWIQACGPDRVKLLQCLIVPGENDDAQHFACSGVAFQTFVDRVLKLEARGIRVTAERSEDLLDSYAMVDPRGRFRQAHSSGHLLSQPIVQVGVDVAWRQVGGCNLDLFRARGGDYADGAVARGRVTPIIALEGLDGVGKSTTLRELAVQLNASVISSPPESLRDERICADESPPDERRDWYHRANRVAMEQASKLACDGVPVAMDRCFASTSAYGAAELGRVASAADVPRGPLRPDVVVLLELPESERLARLARRAGKRTGEEGRLAVDNAFRQRVLDGYRALGAVSVAATGTPLEVVQRIREVLAARGAFESSPGELFMEISDYP
jgi:radical S-adenosyl methionine domain-containing protein 2